MLMNLYPHDVSDSHDMFLQESYSILGISNCSSPSRSSFGFRRQFPLLVKTQWQWQDGTPLYTCNSHFIYSGCRIDIFSPGNKAFYFALEFIFNSCWKSLSHNNALFATHVISSARQIARHLTAWHQVHLVHDKNKTLHCLEITWDTLIISLGMIGLLSLSEELSEFM